MTTGGNGDVNNSAISIYKKSMNKEELITLFKEKLGGWSFEGPQHGSPENM